MRTPLLTSVVFGLGVGLCSSATVAQSFSCNGRLSVDEGAVCDSRDLSLLDERLADAYAEALREASPDGKADLRADQHDWLGLRAACGSREGCIDRVYRERIAELQDRSDGGRQALDGEDDRPENYVALGVAEIDRGLERRVIPVGYSKGRFDGVRFRVRGGRVRVHMVTVVFGNGERDRLLFDGDFSDGQTSDLIELPGRGFGRFMTRISIRAKALSGGSDTKIEMIGRRVRDGDRLSDVLSQRPRFDDLEDRRGRFEPLPSDRDDGWRDDGRPDRGDRRAYLDDEPNARPAPEPYVVPDPRDAGRPQERLQEFVETEFHRTADMSAAELRRTYSREVDYYGDRSKSVEEIIADKRNYASRWPDRAFRVKPGTFKAAETSRYGVYEVTYEYDFHVRSGSRESKGSGQSRLLVDTSGERFVILAENGKVTKRF